MALEVGELYAKIKVEMGQFKTDMSEAQAEFRRTAAVAKKAMDDAEKAAKQAAKEQARAAQDAANAQQKEAARAAKAMQTEYDRSTRQIKSSLKSVEESIMSVAKTTALAMTLITGAAAGFGVAFDAKMEQAHMSFETLLGSVQAANGMLNDLWKFAATTPFEFPDVQKNAKLLLAMGFSAQQVIPAMTAVGNAVSAIGGTAEDLNGVSLALGQILTKGKVSAEEMNQLAERGIGAWSILSEKMGKSQAELMKMGEQGKLLSSDVLPQLLSGLGEKYAGAMDKQSKTFLGILSTVKDNLNQQLGTLAGPLFDQLKIDLQSIGEELSKLGQGGEASPWMKDLQEGLLSLYNTAKEVTQFLIKTAKEISDNWEYIAPVVYGAVAAFTALKVIEGVTVLLAAYQFALKLATAAQLGLNVAMDANPVGLIILGIGALVTAVVALYQAWTHNWGGIQEKTRSVMNVIQEIAIGGFHLVINSFKTMWNGLELSAVAVIQSILFIVEQARPVLERFAPNLLVGFDQVQAAVAAKKAAIIQDTRDMANQTTYDLGRITSAAIATSHAFQSINTGTVEEDLDSMIDNRRSRPPKPAAAPPPIRTTADQFVFKPSGYTPPSSSTAKQGDTPFEKAMKDFQFEVDMGTLSTQDQIDELTNLRDNLAGTTEEYRRASVAIKNARDQLTREKAEAAQKDFNLSKNWIDQEKFYNRLSLDDELAAWERVQARFAEGTEERLQADREAYTVRVDALKQSLDEQYQAFKDNLDSEEDAELKKLDKVQKAYEDKMDKRIQDEKDASDKAIDALQDQMDAIDRVRNAEKDAKETSKNQAKLTELQAQYSKYQNAVSKEGKAKAASLLKEITDLQADMEEKAKDQQAKAQKDSLKQAIDAEKDRIQKLVNDLENERKVKLEAFSQERTDLQDAYKRQEKLADDHYKEMIKLAQQKANDFYDVGKNLMESFQNGMKSVIPDINSIIAGLNGQLPILQPQFVNPSSMTSPSSSGAQFGLMQPGALIHVENLNVQDRTDAISVGRELWNSAYSTMRGRGVRP